jgi:hypothetical protein
MRFRFLLIALALLIAPAAFGATYSLNDWCFYVNYLDVNRSCANGSGVDNFNPSLQAGAFDFYHLADANNQMTFNLSLAPGLYNLFAIFNGDKGNGNNPGGGNPSGGGNGVLILSSEFARVFGTLTMGQAYSNGITPGNPYIPYSTDSTGTDGPPDNGGNNNPGNGSNDLPGIGGGTGSTGATGSTGGTGGNGLPPLNTGDSVATPEPGTFILLGGGIGLMLLGFRRKQKA